MGQGSLRLADSLGLEPAVLKRRKTQENGAVPRNCAVPRNWGYNGELCRHHPCFPSAVSLRGSSQRRSGEIGQGEKYIQYRETA